MFIKFAQANIVSFSTSNLPHTNCASLQLDGSDEGGKQFKLKVAGLKKVAPRSKEFLYVRVRAISAMEIGCKCVRGGKRCYCGTHGIKINQNGDAFPAEELKKAYKTFISKGNFENHQSEDVNKIRGIILDSYWNKKGWVECLIAVDKKAYPTLARNIETGVVHGVSMGCQVAESECSICGNKAKTERDYCAHIKKYKGLCVAGKKAYEINRGLKFIELSWVTNPADDECHSIEKIAKTTIYPGFENSLSFRQRSLNRELRTQYLRNK